MAGGDPFRDVMPGHPLEISSRAWNRLMQIARGMDAGDRSPPPGFRDRDRLVVPVKNSVLGVELPRYSLVSLKDPVFAITDGSEDLAFAAIAPSARYLVAVIQQTLPVDAMCDAVVAGLTLVRCAPGDAGYRSAAIDGGNRRLTPTVTTPDNIPLLGPPDSANESLVPIVLPIPQRPAEARNIIGTVDTAFSGAPSTFNITVTDWLDGFFPPSSPVTVTNLFSWDEAPAGAIVRAEYDFANSRWIPLQMSCPP